MHIHEWSPRRIRQTSLYKRSKWKHHMPLQCKHHQCNIVLSTLNNCYFCMFVHEIKEYGFFTIFIKRRSSYQNLQIFELNKKNLNIFFNSMPFCCPLPSIENCWAAIIISWFNQTGFWSKLLAKLLHHIDAILKYWANRNSEWSVTWMKEGVGYNKVLS